ncbi:MAG: hypothetical protein IKX21_00465 [Deltaproteobacteria bacterium]|nr:hypothetical protein [Deltaproteobacteria bacterium]
MENTQTNTRYFRDHDGWNGETIVELPNLGQGKQLHINTSKTKDNCAITSCASVRTLKGGAWTFLIAGKDGDYFKRVGSSEVGKRATERTVRKQHEAVLATLDSILESVTEHYAAQQRRKEEAEGQRLAA